MSRRAIALGAVVVVVVVGTAAACRSDRAAATSAPAAAPVPRWDGPPLPGSPVILGSAAFRVGAKIVDVALTADAIYALTEASGLYLIARGSGEVRRVESDGFDPVGLVELPGDKVGAIQRNVAAIVPIVDGAPGPAVAVQGRVDRVVSTRGRQILAIGERGLVIVDAVTGAVTPSAVTTTMTEGALLGPDRVVLLGDSTLVVQELATGAITQRWPVMPGGVWPSPDGAQLVAYAPGKTRRRELALWTVATGEQLVLQEVLIWFDDVAWAADGRSFVVTSGDQLARYARGSATPTVTRTVRGLHQISSMLDSRDHGSVLALGPDGAVAVASVVGSVQVFDPASTGTELGPGDVGAIEQLRFVRGDLVSEGPDGLRAWDLAARRERGVITMEGGRLGWVALPGGDLVTHYFRGMEAVLERWTRSGAPVTSSMTLASASALAVDGEEVLFAGPGAVVPIDPATGEFGESRKLPDARGQPFAVDNVLLYPTDGDDVVRVDSGARLPIHACVTAEGRDQVVLAADRAGKFVAAYAEGVLQLWRLDGTRVAAIALAASELKVEGGAVSPDGKLVVFATRRGLLRWDVGTGVTEVALPAASAVAFDGAVPRVAVGFATGRIAIWSVDALPAGTPLAATAFTTPCPAP